MKNVDAPVLILLFFLPKSDAASTRLGVIRYAIINYILTVTQIAIRNKFYYLTHLSSIIFDI